GPALSAYAACVCGRYSLDLGRPADRAAALRLAEWSHWEGQCARAASGWPAESGGTSQKGRWSNFRNEAFRGKPLRRGLTAAFFKNALRDRVPGVLEFDFVSTSRPPQGTPPMSETCFRAVLRDCGLLEPRPGIVA
ncbi:unnamed protein product, partial [Phaeothamnion confervicola]